MSATERTLGRVPFTVRAAEPADLPVLAGIELSGDCGSVRIEREYRVELRTVAIDGFDPR